LKAHETVDLINLRNVERHFVLLIGNY